MTATLHIGAEAIVAITMTLWTLGSLFAMALCVTAKRGDRQHVYEPSVDGRTVALIVNDELVRRSGT